MSYVYVRKGNKFICWSCSQVEYAMEAISHAGICVGILAKDGIVLAVEKKITSKLLENITSEKMYKVRNFHSSSVLFYSGQHLLPLLCLCVCACAWRELRLGSQCSNTLCPN
jgi:20S proteasome alpha/beta subunit